MVRRIRSDEQEFGSDSFLDVIANVVGILIILVMVVGMRIKHAPAPAELPPAAVDVSEQFQQARSLERETLRLAAQLKALTSEGMRQQQRHEELAEAVVARQRELEAGRRQLDSQAQQQFMIERDIWTAQSLAEQLQLDIEQLARSQKKSVTIESYPTPLARLVDGKEAHFQLRAGRIVYIPLEELLKQLKADAPSQFWKLKDLPEATASVGPIGGFRLRYTFERIDVPLEDQLAGRRMISSIAQLSQWTLVPSDNLLGETVDVALMQGSEFRTTLAKLNPRQTTVTLWVYPDSFELFRRIKKELYRLHFAAAARPLPEDTPIGGSPNGTKSAAQ
jgi:hypothetical protein